jgi:hypothetical protein
MKWYFEEIIQISNIGDNIKAFEATRDGLAFFCGCGCFLFRRGLRNAIAQGELTKFDGSAYGEPHFLVIGLDLQNRRHGNELVHIGDVLVEGESIALHLLEGAFVKEIGVGFYVHQGGGRRNLSVQVQELITAQPFALLLGLGVGEGDPNFGDLVWGEVLGDVIDMGSQESNIAEVFGDCGLGARPHAVAFDPFPQASSITMGLLLPKRACQFPFVFSAS